MHAPLPPDDQLLTLVPGIRTRIDAGGHVLVELDIGQELDAGPNGYRILALIAARPAPLGDILAALRREFGDDDNFMPAMAVVNELLNSGALAAAGAAAVTSGWADPAEQARMLHDDRRTLDYLAAIRAAVGTGDVVVDIGTGNGILALAAARAGARQVYAIEATDIADVAEEVFEVNGVGDRVTVVRGWSALVDLPERANVMVTETIGSEPLEEDILGTVLDARRRLLTPDAVMIPNRLTLLARPLLLPDEAARQRSIGPAALRRWKRLYDVDFQPLLDAAAGQPIQDPVEAETVSQWPPVGPVATLATIDFATFDHPHVTATAELELDEPGEVNAVAVTFRADLFGEIEHTLDPWTWPLSSWATAVWVFPESVHVADGELLRVVYRHHVPEHADGLTYELTAAPGS